jgi:pimeloyl-ACP methyl ester carboxylesterase
MKVDNIRLENCNAVLGAKIFLPDEISEAKGFIIFTHGLGYCAKSYQLDGEFFAKNGYIFCMYNMRGHVGSTGEFTTSAAVKDVSFVIDRLYERYNAGNKEMTAIIGHSTGGLISLLAATKDKRIKCGSIISIVTSMADSFLHWFDSGFIKDVRNNYTYDGKIDPGIEKFLSARESLRAFKEGVPSRQELSFKEKYGLLRLPSVYNFFYEIVYSPDIFEHVKDINIPVLFFKGKKDEVIPINKTDKLCALLNGNKKLITTDATTHFFNNFWPVVQAETLSFFNEQAVLISKKHNKRG